MLFRSDNLRYLFTAVFDAARWPSSVYRGVLGFLFTFVIPLGLMTSYPARALLGSLTLEQALVGLVFGVFFSMGSRWIFMRAIARYTSASS